MKEFKPKDVPVTLVEKVRNGKVVKVPANHFPYEPVFETVIPPRPYTMDMSIVTRAVKRWARQAFALGITSQDPDGLLAEVIGEYIPQRDAFVDTGIGKPTLIEIGSTVPSDKKHFRDLVNVCARFCLGENKRQYLPPAGPDASPRVSMHMSVQGGDLDPFLEILVSVRAKDHGEYDRPRYARLELGLSEDPKAKKGYTHVEVGPLMIPSEKAQAQGGMSKSDRMKMYTFLTNPAGVTSAGLDFIDDTNFDKQSLETLGFMRKIRDSKVPVEFSVQAISVVIKVDPDDEKAMRKQKIIEKKYGKGTAKSNIHHFHQSLMSDDKKYPFYPYMSADKARPLVARGQQSTRQHINAQHYLVRHGKKYHYKSVDEGVIKLAYSVAIQLQYENERWYLFNATNFPYVAFKIISQSTVVGFLNGINKNAINEGNRVIRCVPKTPGDVFEIEYELCVSRGTGKVTCIPVSNDYGVPGTMAFRCIRTPLDITDYAAHGEKHLDFKRVKKITMRHGYGVADNQISAMYQLAREPEFAYLHDLFCNQNPEKLDVVDPTSHLDISSKNITLLMNDVIRAGEGANPKTNVKIPWSPEQERAIRSIRKTRGGLQIIKGPAGSGKTSAMCGIAKFIRLTGMGIIAAAPSHASTQNLYDRLAERFAGEPIDDLPLRCYRSRHEFDYYKNAAKSVDPFKLQRLKENEVDLKGLEDDEDLSNMLDVWKQTHKEKPMPNPSVGIAARVHKAIFESPRRFKAMAKYPPTKIMVKKLGGELYETKEAREAVYGPNPNKPSEEVDMLDEAQRLLTKYENEGFDSFDPVEAKKFSISWKECSRAVVARAKIFVTTLNNLQSDLLSPTIGKNGKGFVLLIDEAVMEIEPAIWAAWICTFNIDRIRKEFGGKNPIKAVVLSGDPEQKGPLVTSKKFNEFASQLEYSTLNRYNDSGWLTQTFTVQKRQMPEIASLSENRVYHGKVTTDPMMDILFPMNARQKQYLGTLFHDGKTPLPVSTSGALGNTPAEIQRNYESRLRAWFFDVENSRCVKCQNGSRVNPAHVQVIGQVIRFLWARPDRKPFSSFQRVVILAPWADQVQLIQQELNDVARENGFDFADMMKAYTADAYQSRENDFVILDLVFSSTKERGDLGFMADNRRVNVMMTRPTKFLIVIGAGSVLREKQYANGITNKTEYIIWVMNYLTSRGQKRTVRGIPSRFQQVEHRVSHLRFMLENFTNTREIGSTS